MTIWGIVMGNKIKSDQEYICCGGTGFCKDCKLMATFADSPHLKDMRLSKNALGRCDFYSGPNEQITTIAKLD